MKMPQTAFLLVRYRQDVPGQALTTTISGGEDAALFEIRGGNELNFIAAPDFENPPPPGATPGYQVTVQVSDGAGGIDTQAIAVTVTNVPGISQSGNNSANTLTGTDEEDTLNDHGDNDTLLGQGGNDTMLGGAGNDLLDGGTGADSTTGGAGNDSYVVDSTGDSVTKAAAAGTDLVRTSLGTYTLGANVEHLTFIGTGNTLANTTTGGSSNDVLDGLGGMIGSSAGGATTPAPLAAAATPWSNRRARASIQCRRPAESTR